MFTQSGRTGRPNRQRKRIGVHLAADDHERLRAVRDRNGGITKIKTIAEAIRTAIREADAAARAKETKSPDTTSIGFDILQWAERLQFTSERERRELREFARRLYELTKERKES